MQAQSGALCRHRGKDGAPLLHLHPAIPSVPAAEVIMTRAFTAFGRWQKPVNPDSRNPLAGPGLPPQQSARQGGPGALAVRASPTPPRPGVRVRVRGRPHVPSQHVRTRLPSRRRRGPREVWAPGMLLRLRNKGGLCAMGGRQDGPVPTPLRARSLQLPVDSCGPRVLAAAAAGGQADRQAAALASPLVLPSSISGRKAPEEREEPHTAKG